MESATKDSFLVHMNLDYIAYDGIEFSSCLRRYMEAPWMRSSYLDCLILRAVLMQHLVIHKWRCGNYYERLNWTWNDLSKWNRRFAINVDKPSMRGDLRELYANLSHALSMLWKHYGLSGWVKSLVCNFIIPGSAAYYWMSAQTEPAAVAVLMLSVGLMVQHHQSTVERISMYVPRSVHLNRAHQIRLNLRNILVRFEDVGVIDIEDVKQCLSSTRELGEDIPGYLFLLMRTSPGAGSGVVRARPAAKEIMGMSEGQSDASSK